MYMRLLIVPLLLQWQMLLVFAAASPQGSSCTAHCPQSPFLYWAHSAQTEQLVGLCIPRVRTWCFPRLNCTLPIHPAFPGLAAFEHTDGSTQSGLTCRLHEKFLLGLWYQQARPLVGPLGHSTLLWGAGRLQPINCCHATGFYLCWLLIWAVMLFLL